jgi:hypothetical protein
MARVDFARWETPDAFFCRSDAMRLDAGSEKFFTDRELRHLQEAWTLGKLAGLMGADLVRLADVDPPDGFMQYRRRTVPVEVTELLDEERRRADEYKPGRVRSRLQHVSEAEIERAANMSIVWLEKRIRAKLAKDERYPPNTVLAIYHNTGLWNFESERERITTELETASRWRGTNIIGSVILFDGALYGQETVAKLQML